MRFTTAVAFATVCLSTAVDAHSVVTEVKGANGINGVGMGVIDVTGEEVGLFNQVRILHVTVLVIGLNPIVTGFSIWSGRRQPLRKYALSVLSSRTPLNRFYSGQRLKLLKPNPIDKDAEVQKAVANGLPTPDSNGILSMTMFQVNGGEDLFRPLGIGALLKAWYADGAGPYTCEVSPSGNDDLVPAEVTTDVPGKRGRSRARNQAFPFDVKVPAWVASLEENEKCRADHSPSNLNCTGPGDSCILRCKNAIKQPFGGCVVFGAATPAAAQGSNKRSLFGRLLIDEDPNVVDLNVVDKSEAEEAIDHDTDEAEETTPEDYEGSVHIRP